MSADRLLLLSLIERLYAEGSLSREGIEAIADDLTGSEDAEALALSVRLLPEIEGMVKHSTNAEAEWRRREIVARTRMIEREGSSEDKA